MEFYKKYHKYKSKYISLKNNYLTLENQTGGKREEKPYVDFITKNSIDTMRIDIKNSDDIVKLLWENLDGIDKLICLDFHGVTDLFDLEEKIPSDLPKCVISYIGGNPKTISDTTSIIKSRLSSGEIILGIIVYNKNNLPSCGTKGWIISKFIDVNKNIQIYFIDDSKKNIECVENVKSANIKTFYINKNKNPKKYLTKILDGLL